ncbi:MAG TPA: adenylyltransferase/cytidyltransferase family protein [Verrucomicrobiae bacterium]|jgi:rfaE bifunctional protein nucleotidyltransferase chain/domain
MDFAEKILTASTLGPWRENLRRTGLKLVVTNGCFDVLHLGHVTYLQQARDQGDALLIGVTSDAGVQALKGPGRPLNSQFDRAGVLAALESVDAVYIFAEVDARSFLEAVKPDVYAKGGDYTLDTINQDERRMLEKMGVQIVLLGAVPGKSTTALIGKINKTDGVQYDLQEEAPGALIESMPSESFQASRWTRGNHLFPTVIEVTDKSVVRHKRSWFRSDEMSVGIQKVASVHIKTGLMWSDILIESTGGTDPIASHGHRKDDARRIKELIETYQQQQPPR